MLLAGDVGGTKTVLGVYDSSTYPPSQIDVARFETLQFDGLAAIVETFLAGRHLQISAACFGVAGPVHGHVARLTNVPWRIDASVLARALAIPHVQLLNDVEAMGYAVPTLDESQLDILQDGERREEGNAALVAPGTGLGETLLHNVAGHFIPAASEGGHADFAARTPREQELAAFLTRAYGRASYEHVLTGPGLVTLHHFVHGATSCERVSADVPTLERPSLITSVALERMCAGCVETLDMFVAALGAEAGNLGLRSVATAGVYIGGGISPKILPALRTGTFLDAFRSKSPMDDLMASMPVAVILEPLTALIGAAVVAGNVGPTDV